MVVQLLLKVMVKKKSYLPAIACEMISDLACAMDPDIEYSGSTLRIPNIVGLYSLIDATLENLHIEKISSISY